jgi:hypothetical protein
MLSFVNASVPRVYLGIDLTLISLIGTWSLDIMLISGFLLSTGRIKWNYPSLSFLAYFAIVSVFLGLIINGINSKTVTDILRIGLFPIKILVLASIFSEAKAALIFEKFMRTGALIVLIATALAMPVLLVLIIQNDTGLYYTASPNLMVPAAYYMFISKNLAGAIFTGVLIVFTTKRALLIGFLVLVFLKFKGARKVSLKALIYVVIVFGVAAFATRDLPVWQKYFGVIEQLASIDLSSIALGYQRLFGPRFYESQAIIHAMQPFDWVLGKGIGFIYPVDLTGQGEVTFKGDGHFTPLVLLSKFGIIGTLVFLWFNFWPLVHGRKAKSFNAIDSVMRAIIISFWVQSFFSFLIVNNILYSLALAWLYRR